MALSGRVDLHLEHPPPGDHLDGSLHRRDSPRHLPQHHDRQAVRTVEICKRLKFVVLRKWKTYFSFETFLKVFDALIQYKDD